MDSISEVRKDLRLTQEEVATYLGVHRQTYMKWEADQGTMPLGQYIKLQDKFNELKEMKYGLDSDS